MLWADATDGPSSAITRDAVETVPAITDSFLPLR
jgi:hypothetical protein